MFNAKYPIVLSIDLRLVRLRRNLREAEHVKNLSKYGRLCWSVIDDDRHFIKVEENPHHDSGSVAAENQVS